MAESNLMTEDIQKRLENLAQSWDELRQMASDRGQKLDESLAYQQFAASVEEEVNTCFHFNFILHQNGLFL